MFSYGKRTFVTAPPDDISEYFLGPVPGRAAIQVSGLSVLPSQAYRPDETTVLPLSPQGDAGVSNFIWSDLGKTQAGAPESIGPGPFPGSQFYAARSRYTLLHTCNTWTIEALGAGRLPLTAQDVIFSGQSVARAHAALAKLCKAPAALEGR